MWMFCVMCVYKCVYVMCVGNEYENGLFVLIVCVVCDVIGVKWFN